MMNFGLAEVRHDGGQKAPKSFRMSSGNRRVYTTFAMKFEPLGEAEPELLEERFLLGGRLGDAAQADLSSIGGGQDDVGAVQAREQGERLQRRQRLGVVDSAARWLRDDRRAALQQMLERDPQGIAEKGHHHVGLDARLQLMEQGPDGQLAFERAERCLSLG